jgi:GR25 family glycosyltransferase involved in LPS biosynthesis
VSRKKNIEDILIKSKFNYQFFEATDGKTIDFNQYKHIFTENAIEKIYAKDKEYGHDMTYGGAGIILTTLDLWKTINKPSLIIEDDIVFDTDFEIKLYALYSQLPEDWDILYLGYSLNPKIKQFSTNLWKAEKVYGMFGYIIHPRYITKIMNTILPFDHQLDTELYKINKTSNVYVASPPIVFHPNLFPTEIQIYNYF